MDLERMLST